MKGLLIDSVTFAPIVEHGTLVIGNTDEQTVHMMLATAKGEWKEDVRIGADARSIVSAPSSEVRYWKQEVRRQAQMLGVEIENVTVTEDGTINIY